MPSTYTTNLGIEKIGTGEQSGTWGNTTNTNFDIIDQAINGITTYTVTSTDTGNPTLLQIQEGAISGGRNAFIEFSSSGDLGSAGVVQLTPNDAEKIVYVRNSLPGSRSLIIFQGAYNASNDYILGAGKDAILKFSGTGSGSTVTPVMENPVFEGDISVGGDISVAGTVDSRDVSADGSKLDGIESGAEVNVGTNLSFTADTNQLQVNSSTGNNVDLPAATTSAWGVMTDEDKTKLDGIAAGAQVNVGTNLGRSVSGTGFTLTSSTGNNTTLPAATTSAWGVMTDEDKTKLDGVAPSANNYVHPSDGGGNRAALTGAVVYSDVAINTLGHVTSTSIRTMTLADLGYTGATNADQYGSWTIAASGTAGTSPITSGNTVTFTGAGATTVTRSGDNITITSSDTNTGTNLGNTATGTALTVTSSTGNNTNLPAATTSAWGVMTDDDKAKLDGIAPGATANVGDITGVTAGVGLSGGGSSGSVTLTLDMSELTDMTAAMVGTDEFIVLDAGADRRKAASEIGLSIFNNDSGFTSNTGDITGVTAGNGLSGGGSSGSVTLAFDGNELTTGTAGNADFFVVVGDDAVSRKVADGSINISTFNNDAGFTANVGDITNVGAGVGLSGGGASGSVTLTLDMSELTDMTAAMVGTDEFIVLDAGADRRKAASEIGLSIFNNDSGFTSNTGDITNVGAGNGLTGGGASGSVTLNVGAGSLIDVAADTVSVDLSELTDMTAAMVTTDEFVVLDASAQRRKAASEIGLSIFNNDAGFVTTDNNTTYALTCAQSSGTNANPFLFLNGSSGTDYNVQINGGVGIDVNRTSDTSLNIIVDLSELTDMTAAMVGTDEFIVLDSSADRRKAANEIGLSIFNNDAGFTTNVGDITGVTAGNGLYGGATSGTATVNLYSQMTVGGSQTISDGEFMSVNTSGQTITLPSSPAQGDTVYISVGKFTNTTIARNGSNISGLAENLTVDVADIGITLIYSGNATQGWRLF